MLTARAYTPPERCKKCRESNTCFRQYDKNSDPENCKEYRFGGLYHKECVSLANAYGPKVHF